jgi:hypothetical protein
MIECKACKTQISPKAKTCPKCGHPNTPSFGETLVRFIKVCFFGTIALVALVLYLARSRNIEPETAAPRVKPVIAKADAATAKNPNFPYPEPATPEQKAEAS